MTAELLMTVVRCCTYMLDGDLLFIFEVASETKKEEVTANVHHLFWLITNCSPSHDFLTRELTTKVKKR